MPTPSKSIPVLVLAAFDPPGAPLLYQLRGWNVKTDETVEFPPDSEGDAGRAFAALIALTNPTGWIWSWDKLVHPA